MEEQWGSAGVNDNARIHKKQGQQKGYVVWRENVYHNYTGRC